MDGIERFSRVMDSAERVYEGRERAQQWLNKPNPRFDGRAPVGMLDSDDGARRVEALLGQIDEGFFI
jgi:putative toxin-antitoxin system antitoxin component (TIGR02293 family)